MPTLRTKYIKGRQLKAGESSRRRHVFQQQERR